MITAVVYCSQTGYTRTYARWLAESLGTEALPFERRLRGVRPCNAVHGCRQDKDQHDPMSAHPRHRGVRVRRRSCPREDISCRSFGTRRDRGRAHRR